LIVGGLQLITYFAGPFKVSCEVQHSAATWPACDACGKEGVVNRAVFLAMLLSLGVVNSALGEGRESRRDGDRDSPRATPRPRIPQARPDQAVSANDPRAQTGAQKPDVNSRSRYFSPEERRQLRRDINDAGRDIYRRERRRR
jgi:hypothetical protein